MTNRLLLVVAILAGAACAPRASRSTIPARYTCGETSIVRAGDGLTVHAVRSLAPPSLGWRDAAGDHFVASPQSPTDVEAVEYVLPGDRRKDAVEKTYDASPGQASSDWRLVRERVCRAEGGYTDALARWMAGSSLDQVAKELSLADRRAARKLVHQALVSLQKQYLRDR